MKAQGVRVVPIVDPGVKVDPDYPVYTSGQARDVFVRTAQGDEARGYVWPDEAVCRISLEKTCAPGGLTGKVVWWRMAWRVSGTI
jgi:hypothetical protein